MEKRRFINFRAFLVIAVSVILAAIFAYASFVVQWLGWLLFALGLAFFGTAIFFSLHFHVLPHKFLAFAVGGVLFIAVFFNFIATVNLWHNDGIVDGERYPISGTVDAVCDEDAGRTVIVLKDLSVATVRHRGKLNIYMQTDERVLLLRPGDKVVAESVTLYKNYLIEDDEVKANYKRANVRYNVRAFPGELKFYEGSPSAMNKISAFINDMLVSNMGQKYGGIAYGMLTGDKAGISEETLDAFRLGGISHILAVSGLHVGFAAFMITFILKKLKVGKIPVFVSVSAFLLFYVFIADFSPSVIRAAVMTETGFAASVFGKGKDSLSALCFAVAVILTASPIYLFEAGFLMSVGAVFGIILFADFLCRILCKIRIPKFIASPLSSAVSVQTGILPAQICFFSTVQIYSVFANVLLMPLIAASFCVVLVLLTASCILPFVGYLLRVPAIGLYVIDAAATAIGKLPFAAILVPTRVVVFLIYPLLFLISRFFMLGKAKLPVKLPLAAVAVALFFNGFYAIKPYDLKNVIIPVYDVGGVTSVVTTDDGTYMVGDMISYYDIRSMLIKYRITKLDAVFMTRLDVAAATCIANLYSEFDVGAFYSPNTESIDGIVTTATGGVDNFYMFADGDKLAGGFNCVFDDGKFVCYEMPFADKSALFYGKDSRYSETDPDIVNRCAVIRAFEFENEFPDRLFIVDSSFDGLSDPPRGYSVCDERDLIFDYINGEYLALHGKNY